MLYGYQYFCITNSDRYADVLQRWSKKEKRITRDFEI